MIKEAVFLCSLIAITTSAGIVCPTSSWTIYKEVEERSGLFVFSTDSSDTINYSIYRKSKYQCSDYDAVEFNTNREIKFDPEILTSGAFSSIRYQFATTDLGSCKQNCDEKYAKVQIFYKRRYKYFNNGLGGGTVCCRWSQKIPLFNFTYYIKNCDKLYWTSWSQITNCGKFSKFNYTRLCVDCDKYLVNQAFCNGNATKQEPCPPMWGKWGEAGPCIMTGCNATGIRVRKRKCLYGDDSEAADVQLCSNQSAVMKEQCIGNTTCLESSKSIHFGVYLGISASAVCLLLLLCFLTRYLIGKHISNKKQRHRFAEQVQLHIEHHIYDEIQNNTPKKQSKTQSTTPTNSNEAKSTIKNDDMSPDQLALLGGYEIPLKLSNKNNNQDVELIPSSRDENSTCKKRDVTDEGTYFDCQASGSNEAYMTMNSVS